MSNAIMNTHNRSDGRLQAGFTLMELMIVVAIIAILAAIAYPSYLSSVTKTNRSAAEGCLSQYANYMERYYTTYLRYDQDTSTPPVANSPPTLDCASTSQTGANYTYTLVAANLTATTYVIQAAPNTGGAQAKRDTMCGTLSLNQAGTRSITGTTGTVATCWGG